MMSKFSAVVSFFVGAILGGAATWYVVRDRYARLAEEEIKSVKETYAQAERGWMKNTCGVSQKEMTTAVTAKVTEKASITEYAKKVKKGEPMGYSQTVVPKKIFQAESPGPLPYVIAPDEFGELEEYTSVSLFYFADGVLSDEYGVTIDMDDVQGIIGDALSRFGEYEDDAVFVRDDVKRCDYEILMDEREYDDFRKTLPTNI